MYKLLKSIFFTTSTLIKYSEMLNLKHYKKQLSDIYYFEIYNLKVFQFK